MFGGKRPPEEELDTYIRRTNANIRDIKLRHDVQDLDIVAIRHHFGWAGHISRLGTEQPDRMACKILKYRDREWLSLVESQNYGR